MIPWLVGRYYITGGCAKDSKYIGPTLFYCLRAWYLLILVIIWVIFIENVIKRPVNSSSESVLVLSI